MAAKLTYHYTFMQKVLPLGRKINSAQAKSNPTKTYRHDSPDLIFYRDLDETFQTYNQTYTDYANKTISEIIGQKLHDILKKDEAEKETEIDLVILDMIMPEMNEAKVLAKLRKLNPEIKVLLANNCSFGGQAAKIMT